jgi:protein-tyrosine-phosphatase
MTIHFICRGNAFRSIIAEAYLRSLGVEGIEVMSSGTIAKIAKQQNALTNKEVCSLLSKLALIDFMKQDYGTQLTQARLNKGDLTVFMNSFVHAEAEEIADTPAGTVTWDVNDINEGERIAHTEKERRQAMRETYDQITHYVDKLVDELVPMQ